MRRTIYFLLVLLPFGMGCQDNGAKDGQLPGHSSQPSTARQPEATARHSLPSSNPDARSSAGDLNAFQKVVPSGYECVLANRRPIHAKGDLNEDGRTDVALLLQDLESELPAAAIMVAHGMADSSYQFATISGNLGPEPLHNPDPNMLAIEGEVLVVSYQSLRWGVDLYFRAENATRHRKATTNFWLTKSVSTNLGDARGDGTSVCTTDYLKGRRVSQVKRWDAQKGELVAQPEKQEMIETRLKLFSSFNEDSVYAEQ